MDSLFHDAADRAARYLRGVPDRRVVPADADLRRLEQLDRPLPEVGRAAEDVLRELDEIGSPATVATNGGRYFGYVVGGTLPAAAAANWLVTAWDQNCGMEVMAPGGVALERAAGRWLCELFGLGPDTGVGFVTCTTTAHVTALAAARHALLTRVGWDVRELGVEGAPRLRVVAGEERHVSVEKALGILGFGRAKIERVPTDDQGRIRCNRIPALDERTVLCLQAGNVNTGAFDDAERACALARDAGAWVHVDGAFGMWAAASPQHADLVRGYAGADSWAVDGHKYLNTPYDGGVALVRDVRALNAAMNGSAEYLDRRSSSDSFGLTPEMSRRARGVDFWAALLHLGREGLADLVERTCAFARRFAAGLGSAGYEILNEVVFNQVMVSFGSRERTLLIVDAIQRDGTCWCGSTVWRDRTAMRISVSSWATSAADVERSLDAILGIAAATDG